MTVPVPVIGYGYHGYGLLRTVADYVDGELVPYSDKEHQFYLHYKNRRDHRHMIYGMILCPEERLSDLVWACKQGIDIDWDTLKEWAADPNDDRNHVYGYLEKI